MAGKNNCVRYLVPTFCSYLVLRRNLRLMISATTAEAFLRRMRQRLQASAGVALIIRRKFHLSSRYEQKTATTVLTPPTRRSDATAAANIGSDVPKPVPRRPVTIPGPVHPFFPTPSGQQTGHRDSLSRLRILR
uniref:Uncharacterized protein n=1 Tax=Branchiostoma floridae TaxID=7739 RepID=C3YI41_BRAFL|eukprot:XP_002604167.1 hypothetical protein BRAFLDRAFT_71534 [Branchiostoma floridae]